MISRIVRGVQVNEDTLAVEVIKNVGPGGHYMSQKHTLEHVRELYMPSLFDRESEVAWVKAGKKDVRDMARMKAKKILSEHTPTPLPKDVQLRLTEIVKEAEKQLVKTR